MTTIPTKRSGSPVLQGAQPAAKRNNTEVIVLDDDDGQAVPGDARCHLGVLTQVIRGWAHAESNVSLTGQLVQFREAGYNFTQQEVLKIVFDEWRLAQDQCDRVHSDAFHLRGPPPELVAALVRKERCRRGFTHLRDGYDSPYCCPSSEPVWDSSQVTNPSSHVPTRADGLQSQQHTLSSSQPGAQKVSSQNTGHEGMLQEPSASQPKLPGPRPVTEPSLCPEQAHIVGLALQGHNIFYTGSAGCGKSTVLSAIKAKLKAAGKTVEVLAPTGKVALHIGGKTTWTFAGWTPDAHKKKIEVLKKNATGMKTWQRFKRTDVIIFDEISMVENLHFERINQIMKASLGNPKPFGGVQVIVTGDFCQLPPVKPFQHCITCGYELKRDLRAASHTCAKCKRTWESGEMWAFQSKAWQECNFKHIHLKNIHRQSDKQFIRLLQKNRLGVPFSKEEEDLLMNHATPNLAGAVRLLSTRDEVSRINEEERKKLRTKEYTFQCLDRFDWMQHHQNLQYKQNRANGSLVALNEHRFDGRLPLKVGMLVVLLVNLSLEEGLCNGSQGVICGFEKHKPANLPKKSGNGNEGQGELLGAYQGLREDQIKRFMESQAPTQTKCWPVVQFHNGQKKTIYADCQVAELGDVEPYSLLSRTQIPLAPAWAISIHRSQGMTLERVIVNLSRAFEVGQAYVALSRATSLEGLKIVGGVQGLNVGKGGNAEVRAFLREKFGDVSLLLEA